MEIVLLQAAKEALKNGKSIVSDNTNSSVSAREAFVELAKKEGKQCNIYIYYVLLYRINNLQLFSVVAGKCKNFECYKALE